MPFLKSGRAKPALATPPAWRPVFSRFWSTVPTGEALSLDERRSVAERQRAADIVTAYGLVLSLR